MGKTNYKNLIIKRAQSSQVSEEEFDSRVNILDHNQVEALGLTNNNSYDGDGRWDANNESAQLLYNFVKNNQEYHIVTTVDGDDDDSLVYENRLATINRISYFLATGDRSPELSYSITFGEED